MRKIEPAPTLNPGSRGCPSLAHLTRKNPLAEIGQPAGATLRRRLDALRVEENALHRNFLEAQQHPHNVARETYIDVDGMTQPAPAPRFSRTASEVQFGSRAAGEDTQTVLQDWGFAEDEVAKLREAGALS